jgi:small conductance mechanosensitive channel
MARSAGRGAGQAPGQGARPTAARTSGRARARPPARRRPAGPRAVGRLGPRPDYAGAARTRLRRFRQGTALAVAVTGILLLLWTGQAPAAAGAPGVSGQVGQTAPGAQAPAPAPPAGVDTPAGAAAPGERSGVAAVDTAAAEVSRAVREATSTMQDLLIGFYGLVPKLVVALLLLAVAGVLARVIRPLLRRALGSWEKGEATATVAGILIWLAAIAAGLSVLAGDARALIGSVGLLGLALSWALQAPIESFTGWLLNSFRGYYRVGDRIAVGEVFGDVYDIDFLTTTVWEAGGPEKAVQGEQPTGALITFPNSEVLRANIVNYTRDFPYVWDEVVLGVVNETDLPYARQVVLGVARAVVGRAMAEPAEAYVRMLEAAGLGVGVATEPQVYFSMTDAWTNVTVRYLVPAVERRRWASELVEALSAEVLRPEHRDRIVPSYPRLEIAVREEAPGETAFPPKG